MFKQMTVLRNLEIFKQKHRCLYTLRCKRNYDFDDSSTGSISSEECNENEDIFRMMRDEHKKTYL